MRDTRAIGGRIALAVLAGCAAVVGSAQDKPLLPNGITITSRHLPLTTTPEEELTRLDRISDAIAVIDVQSVHGEWTTPAGDAAVTKVRGMVTNPVKVSSRAQLWEPDGAIAFEFEGGEVKGASVMLEYGEYPLLNVGERYLVWFALSPDNGRGYPFLPFRIDADGRLVQVAFRERQPIGWESPINGLPLREVVSKLTRK